MSRPDTSTSSNSKRTCHHHVLCSRETNLKVKQALTVTGDMGDSTDVLAQFKGQRSPLVGPDWTSRRVDVDVELL